MTGISLGCRIVNADWLDESAARGRALDANHRRFFLRDTAAERKYGFKLARAVVAAQLGRVFGGTSFYVTPKCSPVWIEFSVGSFALVGVRAREGFFFCFFGLEGLISFECERNPPCPVLCVPWVSERQANQGHGGMCRWRDGGKAECDGRHDRHILR